ncbi:hypothetical protein AB833_25535 [Chromatiales bacterium (ex Bugula neritina AB1)]|nr:hypothetical protein AB833_25535 [Chromatiales bacterium (ex Bugula neritina AB1)]
MTSIYLIRHGQASAGSANYDVLSPIGRHQASVLGEYLQQTDLAFDAIYSGTLERQIDTATIATGIDRSELSQQQHFDEYNHKAIFERYLPRLAATDPEVDAAAQNGPNSLMSASVFTKLMLAWTNDANGTAAASDRATGSKQDFESWNSFKTRINDGIQQIANQHDRSASVAVFTSGGVISTLFHTIYNTTPQSTFEMNWSINNASLSHVKVTSGSLRLREFNNISHLLLKNDKSLITQI